MNPDQRPTPKTERIIDNVRVAMCSDMECLARLLAERGFQTARGIYHHECGETLPTVVITRPDTPEWSGVWNPWERAPEYEGDIYGEAQCALTLAGEAIAKWDKEVYLYLPNVKVHTPLPARATNETGVKP